ncbi:MAG: DUF2207 domain-containing protein, partial [Panacibacter sp.]
MKKFFATLLSAFVLIGCVSAQEFFTIQQYNIDITVNENASLNITETIQVHFTENRHGIIRLIPYKYPLQSFGSESEKANRQLESGGYAHTIVRDITVDGWEYDVSTEGDYKSIKIGSADKVINGDQQYTIHYTVLNAINFFDDHSELYFNLIGDRWETTIDNVHFNIKLYNALPVNPSAFLATGAPGSKENSTVSTWMDNKIFSGSTTKQLARNEGLTAGITFPKDFLVQQDYRLMGIGWLLLPLCVFITMFLIWRRWGKDEAITIQTEYYPPENMSPSVAGYIIDDKLDHRDLTALIPYWGAGGYLQVKETEKEALFGLITSKEYSFLKLKELPATALAFEKTLFNGIFATGKLVMLSDLKDVLYVTMNKSKKELETEVDRGAYYQKGSRGLAGLFLFIGIALFIFGGFVVVTSFSEQLWLGISLIASGLITLIFGIFMGKRSEKGTALYQQLAGFKEFIKSVEKDRLQQFLKEDEHYFDKVLPYAIVFDMADTWKDKLK